MDDGQAVMLVILDLSAAFDSIDQEQLLTLLELEYGIQDRALSWFKSYLKDRTYKIMVESESSEDIPLWCGVPQGSVLGPVMFTMYTAPLCRILRKHNVCYHKYADDI